MVPNTPGSSPGLLVFRRFAARDALGMPGKADALAEALQPEVESSRELAVPLRVFIKESRDWENTLSYCLAMLGPAAVGLGAALSVGAPAGVTLGALAGVAAVLGMPVLTLLRATRRLLKSGFTQADATVAFLRDIERKEEEYRFQVGERVTWVDRGLAFDLPPGRSRSMALRRWTSTSRWLGLLVFLRPWSTGSSKARVPSSAAKIGRSTSGQRRLRGRLPLRNWNSQRC